MKSLPGTTIEYDSNQPRQVFSTLFSAGGLMLSQVCNITGLEAHTVQNWVKRGFLSPPKDKKYSQRQLCRIIIINILKESLQLPQIIDLISYVNGRLNDESDDIIDDSELYFQFIELLELIGSDISTLNLILDCTEDRYPDMPKEHIKRIEAVLRIFVITYFSVEYKKKAQLYLLELE